LIRLFLKHLKHSASCLFREACCAKTAIIETCANRCRALARAAARCWLGSEPSPAASDRRARARELSS